MMQYRTIEDTVYFWFAANDTSGSGGDGSTPLADVRLAGAAASAAPVLSPTPALLSHASFPAGCYEVAIAATAANGFSAGNVYSVFCTLAIDGQNPTGFIGSFDLSPVIANAIQISGDSVAADNVEATYDGTGYTDDNAPATQQQLGNIALTGAAVATPAKDAPNGFVIISGENEANDEDSTHALDGTTHDLEAINDGGTEKIEAYYEFSIGGDGIPTGIVAHHQFDKGGGATKNLTLWAYNWAAATWNQIDTLVSGTSLETDAYTLFTSHVGTGANLGLVRFRYLTGSVALSATSKLIVDQIFVEYAIVSRTVGYANGAIWVNTNASNTNTESFIDGTADNPVSTWAAALTLSSQLGITRFQIINGSAITLTGNSDNYSIVGQEYTLALGGQSTAALYVFGGSVSGTGTGSVLLEDCPVGNVTLPPSIMRRCYIFGTITNSGVGDWYINHCVSREAGGAATVFSFGAAVGNTNLNLRAWAGRFQIEAMGDTGTDLAEIEGMGEIIEGTCTGGTVTVSGNFTTSGITNLTLSDDARIARGQLVDDVWDEDVSKSEHDVPMSAAKKLRQGADLIQIDGSVSDVAPTTTDFDTNLTQIDGYFEDAILVFSNGAANAGIGKAVSAYVNANGNVTFVAAMAWPVTPVNGDDFVIVALHSHPVSEIQSGLATSVEVAAVQTVVDAIDDLTKAAGDGDLAAVKIAADTLVTRIVGTLAAGTHNPATAAEIATLTDWINGGRLDVILDSILADTNELVVDDVPGLIAAVQTVVDAIQLVTDLLPDSGALTAIGTDTARLTAARAAVLTDWINDGRLDVLLDAIKVITDAQGKVVISGTAETGTLSITQMTTNLTITDSTQLNDRVITFDNDTATVALRGQQTDITASIAAGGLLTFTALTTAPANGDTFKIT